MPRTAVAMATGSAATSSKEKLGGIWFISMSKAITRHRSLYAHLSSELRRYDSILLICAVLRLEEALPEAKTEAGSAYMRLFAVGSKGTCILSPFASVVTSEPVSSTTPAPSVPRTAGYVETKTPYACIFHSTGFRAADSIRTSTSSGPGWGIVADPTMNLPCLAGRMSAFCMREAMASKGSNGRGSACRGLRVNSFILCWKKRGAPLRGA